MVLQGRQKTICESRPGHLRPIYSLIVGMSGQWEDVATMLNWISAVVIIRSVFANPVTFMHVTIDNIPLPGFATVTSHWAYPR